jgi:hypothetical protein
MYLEYRKCAVHPARHIGSVNLRRMWRVTEGKHLGGNHDHHLAAVVRMKHNNVGLRRSMVVLAAVVVMVLAWWPATASRSE